MACAFKGISIVDLSEEDTLSTLPNLEHTFTQPSGNPSPTTSEEEEDIPDLIPATDDLPIPDAIEQDCQSIKEDAWAPLGAIIDDYLFKRPYSQVSPETT